MSKISYIVLPKHEKRRDAGPKLSSRVIANAMRLLIAVILMSALVVIIMLAVHRAVNVQPVQPWTLAPALVPTTLQAKPPVAVKRDYILCESENLPDQGEFQDPNSTTHCGDQDLFAYATDLYKKCAVISLQLDGETGHNTTVSTTFTSDWKEPLRCMALENRPEVTPTLAHYKPHLPVYNLDEEHLFYGTPLLTKWQDLLNIGEDVLDHCVRLMLVWRYGGIAFNLEPAQRGLQLLRNFKSILDNRREDVIVEKESARGVYSKRVCHSAIGSMLKAFAELPRLERSPAGVREFHENIMRAAKVHRSAVYLATV